MVENTEVERNSCMGSGSGVEMRIMPEEVAQVSALPQGKMSLRTSYALRVTKAVIMYFNS